MAEGSELPVGVATESSQFPGETDVPEVSVDVAKGPVQFPRAIEDSGVLIVVATDSTRLSEGIEEPKPTVGVSANHTQLPVVVVGPEHAVDSGTLEKEHNLGGVLGATRGCARHRHPLVAARCPRARAAASPGNRGDAHGIAAGWWPLGQRFPS